MPTPLITTHNLKISQSNKIIINNAEFSINRLDRIILVGKNGCGKSSLLRVLKGIDTPDEGQIWMAPNLKVDLLEQNPPIPNANNVIDFLLEDNNHPNLSKINFIIEQLGLSDIDLKKKISGGELRKIYLAQSILNEPDIMLLDEPTNHIDLPTINWLEKKLIELNITMIIVSHDQEFLKKIGTKTFWFNKGQLIKREGPYDDFFKWTGELIDIEKDKLHKIKQKIKSETKWSIEGISGRRKRNMGRVRELEKLNQNYENNKISDSKSIDISLNRTNDSSVNIVETFNVFFMYKNTPIQENVITDFNYKIRRNDRIGIIGANGSGKTTLIKILQGIYKPTKGKVKIGERVNVKYFDQNKELIKSNTKNINSNKVSIKTHIKPIKILKKKLTFKENYNLKALPDKIEKLEIKLKKSETILDNNELYYNDKITFDKTLVEITNIKKEISLAEDELLDLQILQDEINKK